MGSSPLLRAASFIVSRRKALFTSPRTAFVQTSLLLSTTSVCSALRAASLALFPVGRLCLPVHGPRLYRHHSCYQHRVYAVGFLAVLESHCTREPVSQNK